MITTSIDIVILTKNNRAELFKTLNSIPSINAEQSINIYIFDASNELITYEEIYSKRFSVKNIQIFDCINNGIFGIYPTMNYSLEFLRGDWVIFMNSGDEFFSRNILIDLIEDFKSSSNEIIFGKASVKSNKSKFCFSMPSERIKNIDKWLKYFEPCHQSIFIKTNIAKKEKFILNSPYGADSEWKRRVLSKYKYKYIPKEFASYYLGGISSTYNFHNVISKLKEPSRRKYEKIFEILKYFLHKSGIYGIRFQYFKSELIGFFL